MSDKIRQIELGFRDIGYIVIPAEFINMLSINDVRIEFIQSSESDFEREAIADYVYLEIKNEITKFEFKDNYWCFAEEETDLLNLLGDYDVTHLVVRYEDNSKEEFMVAWSDLEEDFLSSTCIRTNEDNSMLCITINFDKFQFDKFITEQ